MESANGPLQIIHSFEGFVNGTNGGEEVLKKWRLTSYDLSNFEERVRTELTKLRDYGVMGIVANVGYEDYLDNEACWQRFLLGLRTAADLGMRIWIYDEDGYPSGTAGGKVLAGHPELEAAGLKKMTIEKPRTPLTIPLPQARASFYAVLGIRSDGSCQELPFTEGASVVVIEPGDFELIEVYFMAPLYEGTHVSLNSACSRRFINLLSREALSRFLGLTHMRYFERIPADLRRHVEAFFTDEPSLVAHSMALPKPEDPCEDDPVDWDLPYWPSVPWCDGMEEEFINDHGYALRSQVRALFSGDGPEHRRVRRDFRATVSRIFQSAYVGQVADVCAAIGIDFSGHLLGEDTILGQVVNSADLLQALKHLQRPGIDLLSCKVASFASYIVTHKTAQSASFFGTGKGVMTETSDAGDNIEYYIGDKRHESIRDVLSIREVGCVLALQCLLGVRDFCLYFDWSRFAREDYRRICNLISVMVETGAGRPYAPDFALYYPIEMVWELYTPSWSPSTGENYMSEELRTLQKNTAETCRALFHANAQYVLCERNDVGRLLARGIRRLAYYGPGEPEPDLVALAAAAGVELLTLEQYLAAPRVAGALEVGENIVYATYDGFVFAVNQGPESSPVAVDGPAEAVFPLKGIELERVSGTIELGSCESVFLFRQRHCSMPANHRSAR